MNILWGGVQVAILGAAALGYGGLPLPLLEAGKTMLERLVTRLALGLGLVIMATMAGGWLRIWGPWFHHGLIACGLLLLALRPPRAAPPARVAFRKRDVLWAGPVLALLFFYAAFPPTFYDALLYHLGVPGLYLQSGGFVAWPENLFSALPQNAEMLNLLLLSGGSVHGPKFLSLLAALALFLYLWDWGRASKLRHFWLAPLIFFSIPEVVFLAATEKNDLLLMLFLLPAARLLAALKDDPGNWRICITCGIFLGLAGGVKWQGLLYGAAFVTVYFLTSRAPLGKRFLQAALVALIVLLLVSPWLLKNQATFGNPVHPYLSGFFSGGGEAAGQARQISEGVRRGQGFAPRAILSFFLGMFLSPYSLGLTHVTGVIVLLLLPLLFLGNKTGENRFLLAGCALGFLLLVATSRVPRYFLPLFMVLSLPLAAGWEMMEAMLPRFRRLALLLLFSLAAIQAVQAVSLLERMTLGAKYAWGKLRHELPPGARYLDIVPYYPTVDFINHRLPRDAQVAFLGEERTFYLRRPFLASSVYDANPVLADFLASGSAAEWAEKLRRRRVTHVLYSPRELQRLGRSASAQKISPLQERRLGETLGRWPKLFDDGRYALYQVVF
jgi:hypothetical protein